jgi:hypothetical protein
VRSLYFDTIYDKDYEEKQNGIKNRRKIRLRIYDVNDNFAMLEMKQKDGEYQLKKSLKLNKEDSIELINGNYSVLLKYKEEFAKQCYAIMNMECYKPKTVVEYKRKAFIADVNNIRITFDSDIRTNEINYNIFDKNLILNDTLNRPDIILEVKYNNFLLSYIKDFIEKVEKSETSISKYSIARATTKYYIYM